MIREVQFYNNESDSEPEAGETKQTIKRQIKVKKVAKNDIQFFKMTDNKFHRNDKFDKTLKNSSNLTDKISRHAERSVKKAAYDITKKNKF